jgi:hypothetical protein
MKNAFGSIRRRDRHHVRKRAMIHPMLAAATIAGLLIGQAVAQEARPPAPPEPQPGPAAPETPADRQKNNAAKLAGLVAFVRIHCQDLRTDDARFRGVVTGLGVPFDDLEAGDLHLRALAYADVYARDIPANCTRAAENFGETGRTIPRLFAKR